MAVIEVIDLEDSRLEAYRDLKHTKFRAGTFIAEGPMLVERLLASDHAVRSLLISSRHRERFDHLRDAALDVFVADEAVVEQIVGFPFHRGILACGVRPAVLTLADLVVRDHCKQTLRYAICPEINMPENLGAIFRSAHAFGIDAIILGENCLDPYTRRCLRVSMGRVLGMTVYRSQDLVADMETLVQDLALELVAVELEPGAEAISTYRPAARVGLVFGTEADGLDSRFTNLCSRQVMIPMVAEEASLNVGSAAAICFYQLTLPDRS